MLTTRLEPHEAPFTEREIKDIEMGHVGPSYASFRQGAVLPTDIEPAVRAYLTRRPDGWCVVCDALAGSPGEKLCTSHYQGWMRSTYSSQELHLWLASFLVPMLYAYAEDPESPEEAAC